MPTFVGLTLLAAVIAVSATQLTDVRSDGLPPAPGALSVLREDPGINPNPIPLWKSIDAEEASRHQHFASGGPDGGPFRRLRVEDEDSFSGERAELAHNSWKRTSDGSPDTFFLYNEGDRRVTEFWMRLATDFPLSTSAWQVVTQIKQTWPSSGSGGSPVLALEARRGQLQLQSYGTNDQPRAAAPIQRGVWTKVSLDVNYSVDPAKGAVQMTVGGVASPVVTMQTLKPEIAPGESGLVVGEAIPSHLRLGVYHSPSLPGTHVDYADVRVLG